MRRLVLFCIVAAVALLMALPASAQVPRHDHVLTLAGPSGGSHVVGGGLANAPCVAFLNFHFKVHIDVFVEGESPHTLTPVFTGGVCP